MTILDGPLEVHSAPAPLHALERVPRPIDRETLSVHYPWLRAVAHNLVRDPWRAEDVAQETLLAALAAPPPNVSDTKSLRAWLGRVAFNLAHLGARSAARQRAREIRVARREAQPGVSEELEGAATVRTVGAAIATLDEPERSAIRMRYFEGCSTSDIASHLGISELAARKRLWRARNKLRQSLERGARRADFWAGLWLLRGKGVSRAVAGLAAGVVVSAGWLAWWSRSTAERLEAALAIAAPASAPAPIACAPAAGPLDPAPASAGPAWGGDVRRAPGREVAPPETKTVEPFVPDELRVAGRVVDLEANPVADLPLFAPSGGDPLATSGKDGTFELAEAALPLVLTARADGWCTLVRAQFLRDDPREGVIVVAPSAPLAARVIDESGAAVVGARLELRCAEQAFARIPWPLPLAAELLGTAHSDALGLARFDELARGHGLFLRVEADGFAPRELATEELGTRQLLTLRALRPEEWVAGTVYYQNGMPAAHAEVRLGLATGTADEFGRFRLPLRGVENDSSLVATDPEKTTSPAELKGFGSRLADENGPASGGTHDIALFLGAKKSHLRGRLQSPEGAAPAADWLVAAFRREANESDPVASARSDTQGAFDLWLEDGSYDLFALAPDVAQAASRTDVAADAGGVEIPLPRPNLVSWRGEVRAANERVLAGSEVEVLVRLDGERRLSWKHLTSDSAGLVTFACDPSLTLEVSAQLAGFAPAREALGGASGIALVLAEPSYVRLARLDGDARRVRFLDAAGGALEARGPLHAGSEFALDEGASPVLEVPPSARWVELRGTHGAALLPLHPEPGKVVHP
jgi:RNA polymerase sigma factor (sigma-70 family)